MKKSLLTIIFTLLISTLSSANAEETADAEKLKAKKIADEITSMRSNLAESIVKPNVKITPKLFKSVCGVVKKRAMEQAKKKKVKIRHAAIKNRNPDHAATAEEISIHRFFSEYPDTKDIWKEITVDGKNFKRYVRPIYVEPACLACHGEKETIPDFIKKKYPEDKAFGFKEGDLRGIMEVWIPVDVDK